MSFPFNTSIPAGTNNPSLDRPTMQQNNVSTNDILAVDHITFGNTRGGQHQQVTLAANQTPAAVTNPTSIIYSAPGASSTNSQLFYKNSDIVVELSAIRAWASCTITAGVATIIRSSNVVTVATGSTGIYNITLSTGSTKDANFAVLITPSISSGIFVTPAYNITGTDTFTISFAQPWSAGFRNPAGFSIAVLQV